MIDLFAISLALLFLISNYLAFGYGVRIGKAMQKEMPPAPLVEPTKKAARGLTEMARRGGKRMFKLVRNIGEAKAFKKAPKKEESVWD